MTTNEYGDWPSGPVPLREKYTLTLEVPVIMNDCTVLGEIRWGREVLQVVHTPDDTYPRRHGGYQYAVRWNHTTEIRCNTLGSAWSLFDRLAAWPDFAWMFTHH